MNQTIAQFLNIKDFPFVIRDKNGKEIYYEKSDGFWEKREYNARGNEIYYETSNGCWSKHEYNARGNVIYFENSNGHIFDKRLKRVVEMTLQQIADKLGMDVKTIRIKD